MRDRTRYIDGAYKEGSKVVKSISHEDREHLRDYAITSGVSLGDSFLREPVPAAAPVQSPNDEASVKKEKAVEIALAAPKAHRVHAKMMPDITKIMMDCLTTAEASLRKTEEKHSVDDVLQKSYELTIVMRVGFVEAWLQPHCEPLPSLRARASAAMSKSATTT